MRAPKYDLDLAAPWRRSSGRGRVTLTDALYPSARQDCHRLTGTIKRTVVGFRPLRHGLLARGSARPNLRDQRAAVITEPLWGSRPAPFLRDQGESMITVVRPGNNAYAFRDLR